MARKMPADQLEVYRYLVKTEWLDEQGNVTATTTDVYGPHYTAQAARDYGYRWAYGNYYLNSHGQPDYSKPKKRRTGVRQKLDTVLRETVWEDGRREVGADLIWKDLNV